MRTAIAGACVRPTRTNPSFACKCTLTIGSGRSETARAIAGATQVNAAATGAKACGLKSGIESTRSHKAPAFAVKRLSGSALRVLEETSDRYGVRSNVCGCFVGRVLTDLENNSIDDGGDGGIRTP